MQQTTSLRKSKFLEILSLLFYQISQNLPSSH